MNDDFILTFTSGAPFNHLEINTYQLSAYTINTIICITFQHVFCSMVSKMKIDPIRRSRLYEYLLLFRTSILLSSCKVQMRGNFDRSNRAFAYL